MERIGVVGAGTMGTDIAYVAAEAGFIVQLFDVDENKSLQAREKIIASIQQDSSHGIIKDDEATAVIERIEVHQNLRRFSEVDIAIECITEDLTLKKEIFQALDSVCRGDTVLATNTSALSITDIASATKRPESVLGLHFFIPARQIQLVEIIPAFMTSTETRQIARDFVTRIGREYIEVKDYPAFVINRMLYSMINEAVWMLYEGMATAESIDRVFTTGLGLAMGPLAIADTVGLDVLATIGEKLHEGYGNSRYSPCPLMKKHVEAGYTGKQKGRGFYVY